METLRQDLGAAESRIEAQTAELSELRDRVTESETRTMALEQIVSDLGLMPDGKPRILDFSTGQHDIELSFIILEPSTESLVVEIAMPGDAEFESSISLPSGRSIGLMRFAASEPPCIGSGEKLTCVVNYPAIPEAPGEWRLRLRKLSESSATVDVNLTVEPVEAE